MQRLLILCALYLLGAWYAGVFIRAPDDVTLFWPASGLAYAAVIRYGPRWAFYLVVPLLLNHWLFSPVPPVFLPFSIASNVLGVLVGDICRRAVSTRETRLSVLGGFGLVVGAAAMSAVSGLIGAVGMYVAGIVQADEVWRAFAAWAMGDLLGITCMTPSVLILTAAQRPGEDAEAGTYSGLREKAIWVAAMLLVVPVFALPAGGNNLYSLGLVALPLALLLWSAVRFEPIWSILGTATTVLVLISMTGLGLAGFRPPNDPLDAALLLGFMSLVANIPPMLMAAMHEQRSASRKMLLRAVTDADTGLPNRYAFEAATREALASDGQPRALAYLDLDHLSLINDTVSHAAGDAMIQGVGSLLRSRIRPGDALFRIGGDEFALLLQGSSEEAQGQVRDMLQAIEHYRMGWHGQALNATASAGLVPFAVGEIDYAQLLSLADSACFTAKELGGNRICVATQDQDELQQRNEAMHWAVRIREALDRGLFELDCQSISALDDRQQRGRHFEVLLRMRDPATGQRLAPGHFIPAAERFHLGVQLDRHVIELALGWLESHPEAAADVELCAINLTAASMVDDDFQRFLIERVRRSSLPARKLCFEVTETSAVRDLARAQTLIAQMRALGCAFALDDFGTGFCSFNYLRSLDVDFFKIDGSFVRDLEHSQLSTAVVRSITEIAHVLRKKTIAEQTENEAVCGILRALGVDYAQGYGLHRPEPLERYFSTPSPVRVAG